MSDEVLQEDNPSLTIEKIEESFLTCPICYEVYHHPKCLPCLHTFCRHCLGSYIESQEGMGAKRKMGFPCPVCKQFVFVKNWTKAIEEWVDDIQNNFPIQNMIDCLVARSEPESPVPQSSSKETENPSYPTPSAPPPESSFLSVSAKETETPPRLSPSAPPLEPEPKPEHKPEHKPEPKPELHTFGGSDYAWSVLNTGYQPPTAVLRPSSSTIDISSSGNTSLTANNLFRNRSNSSNDLSRQETTVLFQDTIMPWKLIYRPKHRRSRAEYSDLCYLPKQSSIVLTDYHNCEVTLFKNILRSEYDPESVTVRGRPCSIVLLDSLTEDCVVVNLQNQGILIFISVPDMEIIREVRTARNYRSLAVLFPTTLLVGSCDRPARIDMIKISPQFDIMSVTNLVTNGPIWDLSSPVHMCMLSPTSFLVSDSEKKSLICFDIIEESRKKKAKKRFTIAPTGDRKFRLPGSLFCDKPSGNIYTVDFGDHSVLRVVLGDTQLCETLLTKSDEVSSPSAACLGLNNRLCVVDWEGNISVYAQGGHKT